MKKLIEFNKCALTVVILLMAHIANAQIAPLGASHFRNQYLNNPAMAGLEKGLSLNLTYRQQWDPMPGAPESQSITGEFGFDGRVGLGVNIYHDQAGLLKWTQTRATYAYHLPLSQESALHLGLSLGFSNNRLNVDEINADPNDAGVGQYNDRKTFLDGDFGLAYTREKLTLQAALPNLKRFFDTDFDQSTVDWPTMFLSAAYKINLERGVNNGATFEPKVNFRGIHGYHNIVDLGANLNFLTNQIQLFGIYHTSRSSTYGFGFQYKAVNFSGMYTTENSNIRSTVNGSFELSLKFTGFRGN